MPRRGGYLDLLAAVQDKARDGKLTQEEKEQLWQVFGVRVQGGRKRKTRRPNSRQPKSRRSVRARTRR